ncbi:MAG: 23S rRNA (guanosine(2251)-2'-O)-methyltransferase RlmB [Bacilli bacterium]|jgi:23S rRNA (guanosine2251-2'-O)-methyltransferase|nr:23S rRNA (guanosine(2251)-2'-O)-methyltransferase RlmB [Bacilli bacterium]MDD4005863.1 23S rRNA (guanosine(2251)-2'-O)-methyltransferase RlmB [Bacilli bacterium]
MAKLIYGRNPVLSSLGENRVEKVFIDHRFSDRNILEKLKTKRIPIERIDHAGLDKLAEGGLHQGIVAVVHNFRYFSLEEILIASKDKKFPLVIVLDSLKDPHNLGAILRTCDAFGVDGVIIKKHDQVPLNATVAKVSTGAINYVKVSEVTNLSAAIQTLKNNGFWVVSTDGSALNTYREIDYQKPIALVLGSEGDGVSNLLLKRSDYVVKIPMSGHVNSLNVSVAAGIIIAHINATR